MSIDCSIIPNYYITIICTTSSSSDNSTGNYCIPFSGQAVATKEPKLFSLLHCLYHPDTSKTPGSEEKFKEISAAYEKQMFICKGNITEIRTDVEWRYMSCTTCKSGLQEDKTCFQCNKLVQYPTQRYRIMTTISDGEASVKLVLFDKEAEKVIGKPITKLLDIYEQENGRERVFEILQQCIATQHTFKVKLGMSKYGSERELKVQKTLTPQKDEESKIVNNKSKEKVTVEQEGPLQPPTIAGVSTQTPEKKEKRKSAEKARRGEKEIKMEGSIVNKRPKAQETTP